MRLHRGNRSIALLTALFFGCVGGYNESRTDAVDVQPSVDQQEDTTTDVVDQPDDSSFTLDIPPDTPNEDLSVEDAEDASAEDDGSVDAEPQLDIHPDAAPEDSEDAPIGEDLMDVTWEDPGAEQDVWSDVSDLGEPSDLMDAATGPVCKSYMDTIQPIFESTCVFCHTQVSPSLGLSLTAGESYNELVNKTSAYNPSLFLVLPGDPDNSFLYEKLFENPQYGSAMPTFGALLSAEETDLIHEWILLGAVDTPYACDEPGGDLSPDSMPGDANDEGSSDPGVIEEDLGLNTDIAADTDEEDLATPADLMSDPGNPTMDPGAAPDLTASDAGGDIGADVVPEPTACDTPMTVSPSNATRTPLNLLNIQVTGGSGPYFFEFIQNNSGGILHPANGSYYSGANGSTTDTIRISDLGCATEIIYQIQVVEPMVVLPGYAKIVPNSCLQIAVTGGSGVFEYSLSSTSPLGSVGPSGLYTSGAIEGIESIQILDTLAEESFEIQIAVDAGASIQTSAKQFILPVGSRQDLGVTGGSGVFSLGAEASFVHLEDGVLVADSAGSALVTVNDTQAVCPGPTNGMTTQVTLTVVEAIDSETIGSRVNPRTEALAPGDLDGDGFPDLIAASPQTSYTSLSSGVVYIYKGNGTGMDTTPAQILTPPGSVAEFGTGLAVADVNLDGELDLLIGAPNDGSGGSIYFYYGQSGTLFPEEPDRTISNTTLSDYMGYALTVCDFNDDDLPDIAAGTIYGEETNASRQQGSIQIFYGSPDGYGDTPDQEIFGKMPTGPGNTWQGEQNLYLGEKIASGDFDGDGDCDLAAFQSNYNWAGGAIFLYEGSVGSGLSDEPIIHWAPVNGIAGTILLRDVDQDGLADLVFGSNWMGKNGPSSGAAFIARGGALTPDTNPIDPYTVDWVTQGTSGYHGLGTDVALGDVNGDGIEDLLVGAESRQGSYSPHWAGQVRIHLGQLDDLPESQTEWIWGSADELGNIGSLAVLGDLDGDGRAEIYAEALDSQENGVNSGMNFLISGYPERIFAYGDLWRYDWSNTDLGTSWTSNSFDDSTWTEGPGILGINGNAGIQSTYSTVMTYPGSPPPPTAYFRKTLTLDKSYTNYIINSIYFSGMAMWVNDQLVFTRNLNGSPTEFEFGDFSGGWLSGSPANESTSETNPNPFVMGSNTIAVMVKKPGQWTPHLWFDMELSLSNIDPIQGPFTSLEAPARISGNNFGASLSVVGDVNGDGEDDLVIGARSSPTNDTLQMGRAMLYLGTPTGFENGPVQIYQNYPLHESYTNAGNVARGAGDFDGDGQSDIVLWSETQNMRSAYPVGYSAPSACMNNANNRGAAFIFGGSNGDVPLMQPDFVVFGPYNGSGILGAQHGFDFNGDGLNDLALSNTIWNQPGGISGAGGVAFYRGRPKLPSNATSPLGPEGIQTQVICTPDAVVFGPSPWSEFGTAMAPVGDLDGDGCDEMAISTITASFQGANNVGNVTIVYGFGTACANTSPRSVTLHPANTGVVSQSFVGESLTGGADFDGDGTNDLAVGAPQYRVGGGTAGAVFLISGAHIASMPTQTLSLPSNPLSGTNIIDPDDTPGFASDTPSMLVGTYPGVCCSPSTLDYEAFGASLTFVPGVGATGVGLAIGSSTGRWSGTPNSGDVRIYGYDDANPTNPWVLEHGFSGETYRSHGQSGGAVDATSINGLPYVIVGGYAGTSGTDSSRIDDGTVYVLPLSP